MPYIPTTWADAPATTSPVAAVNLNKLETGVQTAQSTAENALSVANGNNSYADAKALTGVRTPTATANFTAVVAKHNPADATAAVITVSMPTATGNAGARFTVEKVDSTPNAVNITGPIRSTTTATESLVLSRETIEFLSDGAGAWWPVAGRKTLSSLDSRNGLPSYAPANLINTYDPRRNCYNYKPENTRRIRRGNGRARTGGGSRHLIASDSGGAGVNDGVSTPFVIDRQKCWPMEMANELARHGIKRGGTFYRFVDGSIVPAWVTSTGTHWVGSNAYTSNSVSAETLTLTIPAGDPGGVAVAVEYFDASLATWTISVNGAVSGPGFLSVTGVNSASFKYATLLGVTIAAGDTVKITKTNALQTIFTGAEVFTPNGGVRVINASQSGAKASGTGTTSWVDTTISGLGIAYLRTAGKARSIIDGILTSGTNTLQSASAAFTLDDVGREVDLGAGQGSILPLGTIITSIDNGGQVRLGNVVAGSVVAVNATGSASALVVGIGRDPDCIHISIGGNDHPVISSPGVGQTLITTIIAAITTIRANYPNSDVILYIEQQLNPSLVTNANWEAFAAAMYTLADTLDVPLFDIRHRIGNYTAGQANNAYGDQQAHLRPEIYSDWGGNVAEVLAA